MPLFSHKNHEPVPAQAAPPPRTSTSSVDSPRRSGGFFSRRRSSSPDTMTTTNSHTTRSSGGIFHRNPVDPSILSARERVATAENAEREADRALIAARAAVKDARGHVKHLEREAAEEARLAKIKQGQAADISKRAKPLGRHGF